MLQTIPAKNLLGVDTDSVAELIPKLFESSILF